MKEVNSMSTFLLKLPLVKDFLLLLIAAGAYAVLVERGGGGAEKRAEAVNKLKSIVDAPGGLDLPAALSTEFFYGLALDVVIKVLNVVGFSQFFK